MLFLEIGGDLISFVAKFAIGILSGSSAMIAEGFHSLADTANHFFLLTGIANSKKPADEKHPFGYGKERFFWAFLSALFILEVSGGAAIYRGIDKIRNPEALGNFNLSFLVLGVALVIQLFTLLMSSKYYLGLAGKIEGVGVFSKMKFVKEPTAINLWLGDWLAVIGNVLAGIALFLVQLTGNTIYDGAASVVIGFMLAYMGLFLINDTKKLLIGEAVTPAMYEDIVEIIRSCPEVRGIVKLKTMHLTSNEVLINADIDFQPNLDTQAIEKAVDKIEHLIKTEIPAAKQISIEVESRNNNRSFTLIELLVVIAIIGLLASIVLVSMGGVQSKAKMTKRLEFSQSIQHVLGAYAVGIWSFDEGSGTTALDGSGYGNNGTINGASYSNSTPHSIAGIGSGKYSLSLDGVNDYVDAGNLGNFYSQGTIEFWMNPSVVENWRNPFTTKYNGGNAGIRFEESSAGAFAAIIGDDTGDFGGAGNVYLSSGLTANRWYHVVLTWDVGSNRALGYLDGVQKFNEAHTKWPTTLPAVAIGQGISLDTERFWKGLIDEVRIYEKALTLGEIQKHYAEGLGRHQNLVIK